MTDMRLVVVGAGGRMGRTLIRAIAETKDCVLAGAIEREGHQDLGKDAGVLAGTEPANVRLSWDAPAAFAKADGVLDFTVPAATLGFAALAAQARIVHVAGTTGLSADDVTKIAAAARHAVIIRSGNMSLGVNLLAGLVKQAAAALGSEFDIEIVEMHHRNKVDAPSGTAYLLGEAAAKGRGIELSSHSVSGRHGLPGARREGDIGFSAVRGGSVTGDHSVIFAGPRERITISHHAEDRSLFAAGALRAALWGRGQKPGLYSMADVLGLPS
jgi:4-hydroxy-tetrahydrodipicolinate reductase